MSLALCLFVPFADVKPVLDGRGLVRFGCQRADSGNCLQTVSDVSLKTGGDVVLVVPVQRNALTAAPMPLTERLRAGALEILGVGHDASVLKHVLVILLFRPHDSANLQSTSAFGLQLTAYRSELIRQYPLRRLQAVSRKLSAIIPPCQ